MGAMWELRKRSGIGCRIIIQAKAFALRIFIYIQLTCFKRSKPSSDRSHHDGSCRRRPSTRTMASSLSPSQVHMNSAKSGTYSCPHPPPLHLLCAPLSHPAFIAMPSTLAKRSLDDEEAEGAPAVSAKKPRLAERPVKSTRRDERNEVMAAARAAWEELRPKAVDAEKTARLVTKLFDLLQGRVVEFVFRHDGSRIVQWMLGDGDEAQVGALMDELLLGARVDAEKAAAVRAGDKETDHLAPGESGAPFFVRLAGDRYGRHLAMKMLRVSVKHPRHRGVIFDACLKGNAAVMVRNAYGADVLDFAFQTTLNATQRSQLVVELLFSRERKILKVVQSKMAGKVSESGAPLKLTFAAALVECGDDFKGMVVDNAGAALAAFVDKPALVRLGVVHAALDEYLGVLLREYPAARARELAALLAPSLVHLAHTKPGVSCAIACVKVLDAKHRKKVVRSLKGHVRALVAEECGHRLLLAVCDWVDDTKLVGKALTAELFSASKMAADLAIQKEDDVADGGALSDKRILPGRVPKPKKVDSGGGSGGDRMDIGDGTVDVEYLKSLFLHKHGRMLFLSLLFPRDTRYFHPALYGSSWEPIDEEKFGKTSKKDPLARQQELWTQFSGAVGNVIAASCRELLMSHWSAPVLIGAIGKEELRDLTTRCLTTELRAVVSGNEGADSLRRSVCAQKTYGVVFKVGGPEVGNTFVVDLGTDVVAKLGAIERWAAAGCSLLASTGCKDVAKLVVKAKVDIKEACGPAGERLVAEATELKKKGSSKK